MARPRLRYAVPLPIPGLRAVSQPHQAQFVLYDIPDDLATRFDCASRLTPGAPTKQPRAYGHHFGSTFRIAGARSDTSIALLWAKENGYWKIVSRYVAPKPDETPAAPAPPEPSVVRIRADFTLVNAAKDFVDAWLIRKNYDAAFRYLSTRSYACYDVVRGPDAPASTSPDDAGRKIRAGLERVGQWGWAPTATWKRSSRPLTPSTPRFD